MSDFNEWMEKNYGNPEYIHGFVAECDGSFEDFCDVEYEKVEEYPIDRGLPACSTWMKRRHLWVEARTEQLMARFTVVWKKHYVEYLKRVYGGCDGN